MMIDISGIYNYDSSIFENLALPEGVEKDQAVNSIIMECLEMPVIYSNPLQLKNLIRIWSRGLLYKWTTLYKSTQLEYNPIENYDRFEEWEEDEEEKRKVDDTVQATSNNTGNANQTDKVKGFDSGEFTDKSLMQMDENSNISSDTTSSGNVDATKNYSRTGRAHGNIGVTTTQHMLEQERKIADFSIYKVIANDFVQSFCVMVY